VNSTAIWALRTVLLAAVVLAAAMTPQLGQSGPQSSTREPATKSSQKNAVVYMDRSEGYMHAEKYAEAAEGYKKVVAIEPPNATAYFGLAISQSAPKQWRPAEEAASRYISLCEHPEPVVYVTLGRAQQQQGKLQEAAEAYGKAIASNPSQEMLQVAHDERGLIHFQLKQYQAAIRDFQEVLKVDPEDEEGNLGLARSYMQDRETLNAIKVLRAFLVPHPENSSGHFYLGLCYVVLGNRTFAEHEYQIVLGLDKKTAQSMRELLDGARKGSKKTEP